jgi:16S rRNA G966 N2-methylase RsmD
MVQNIVVDSEFKNLIPPLQETEFQQLEASILSEGCRDALVLWKGQGILVDGHNRFEICQKHSLPYQVIEREFDNRSQVAEWMLRNQLGRRNLTDAARIQAAMRFETILETDAKERQVANLKKGNEAPVVQNFAQRETGTKTREKLGEIASVSHEKFRQGKHVISNAPQAVKTRWEKDEISTNRAYIMTKALDQSPTEHREQIAELCQDNDEKVNILNRLYKSAGTVESNGTFFEVLKSGGFHYGDDMKLWCDFKKENVQRLQRALDNLADYHKRQARDQRKATIESAATNAEYALVADEPSSYKLGDVIRLGNHILLCADNSSEQARDLIQSLGKVELVFCDPPYNAGAAAYDDGSFEWTQDFLADMADVVAVTPGISSIQSFMKKTNMPYKWSTSAYIANGMTRGALGFGNWIYTALFSQNESIHRNRQDVYTITIGGKQLDMGDKKQKPSQYLAWLFELLSTKGAWIVDAFGGSGNSVIVAHELGRKCLIIERDVETFNQMVANVSAHIEDELELAA